MAVTIYKYVTYFGDFYMIPDAMNELNIREQSGAFLNVRGLSRSFLIVRGQSGSFLNIWAKSGLF